MQLRTLDGKLTLGSVYKLFFWGWLLSWSAGFGLIFIALAAGALFNGEMAINGEIVTGRGAVLRSLLPFFVLAPLLILLHAAMFGGFLTFGVWLYRRWRPLTVVADGRSLAP